MSFKNKFNNFKLNFKKSFELKDLMLFIGAGALFYGIYLIFPPAAFIVIGSGCIYLGMR